MKDRKWDVYNEPNYVLTPMALFFDFCYTILFEVCYYMHGHFVIASSSSPNLHELFWVQG